MTTTSEALYAPVTMETAPEAVKPLLEKVRSNMGFVPNPVATFAHNPTALYGYLALDGALQKGSFTEVERQLILLAASVENKCDYSIAAHATAVKQLRAFAEVVIQVRNGGEVTDPRLNALVSYGGVLSGVAMKTISNYLNHISPTLLDNQFEAERVHVLTEK